MIDPISAIAIAASAVNNAKSLIAAGRTLQARYPNLLARLVT